MFYSQIILAKKGPLGQLWQAAHFQDRKLTRPQIFATNITESVESIVHPAVPLALRVSGHLLLGVVRIYSKKVHYLWQDAHQAMVQIQMAFVPASAGGKMLGGQGDAAIDMEQDAKGRRGRRKTRGKSSSKDDRGGDDDESLAAIPATTALQGFGIPFDLNDESMENTQDWIPAEPENLEDANLYNAAMMDPEEDAMSGSGSPARRKRARAAADLTLHSDDPTVEGRRSLATTEKEQWTAFDPDDDEEEEEEVKEKAPPAKKFKSEKLGQPKDDQAFQSDDEESVPPPSEEQGIPPPPPEDGDLPMAPQDEDQQEKQQPTDTSSLQSAEVPRANESVTSGQTAGHASAVLDKSASTAAPRLSEQQPGFDLSDDVSGIPILDEDAPAAGRASSFHLDRISDAKPLDESSTANVSLGGASTPDVKEEDKKKKKRKSDAKKARRKRRKIRAHKGPFELSSSEIKNMLNDTSDLFNVPPPVGQEDRDAEEPVSADMGWLVREDMSSTLMNFLSYEQLFPRPALADDGGASPEVLELWLECRRLGEENTKKDKAEEKDRKKEDAAVQEEEEEEEEDAPLAAEEPLQQVEEAEEPVLPEEEREEEEQPPPEEEAPPLPEEEEVPMLPEETEPPLPEDESLVDEAANRRKSSLLLGLVNTLGEDMEWDAEEGAVRQEGGDEIVSSNSKWHKHTKKVFSLLKSRMAPDAEDRESHLQYNVLSEGCSRRTAVGVFFELLQLKTWDFVELDQDEPYGDITIAPGAKFDEPVPS